MADRRSSRWERKAIKYATEGTIAALAATALSGCVGQAIAPINGPSSRSSGDAAPAACATGWQMPTELSPGSGSEQTVGDRCSTYEITDYSNISVSIALANRAIHSGQPTAYSFEFISIQEGDTVTMANGETIHAGGDLTQASKQMSNLGFGSSETKYPIKLFSVKEGGETVAVEFTELSGQAAIATTWANLDKGTN